MTEKKADSAYVIGIDFGTDSVRALIVNTENGEEVAHAVSYYPRWKKGLYCDPSKNRFRQHPLDYIESLEQSVTQALAKVPKRLIKRIAGISVDTTGSTPCAVNTQGLPLALCKGFEKNPNAMFVLWKDHTSVQEAADINQAARQWKGPDYTKYSGGIYSSEWFWAKITHILRTDKKIRAQAYSWVEHCDWIPALLCGNTDPLTLKRSRCAAGHKALWHEEFNGLPPEEFLVSIDPLLTGLRARLFTETLTADKAVGTLSGEWAKRLGLAESVVVGAGAFDAHTGAVGAGIEAYTLAKVMGTSTCDILVAPKKKSEGKPVAGICGQVDGSVIPGMLGLEAGQSAFGDLYAWWRSVLMWPIEHSVAKKKFLTSEHRKKIVEQAYHEMIARLSAEAEKIPVGESGIVALDWMNGRRTPDANQLLTGAITGLNLASDAPAIFRALAEATAFGAKKITDRFAREGIPIKRVVALGGVARKSPFIMQICADVLGMPIRIARSEQACALGTAMFAAVAAGVYPDVLTAQKAMAQGFEAEYKPDAKRKKAYQKLYARYTALGEFIEKDTQV